MPSNLQIQNMRLPPIRVHHKQHRTEFFALFDQLLGPFCGSGRFSLHFSILAADASLAVIQKNNDLLLKHDSHASFPLLLQVQG